MNYLNKKSVEDIDVSRKKRTGTLRLQRSL